jgi:hypothetical protein
MSPITIIVWEKTSCRIGKAAAYAGRRYVSKGEPRAIAICHCTHCQRQSGSLFSFNLVMREADYDQRGETRVYVDMRQCVNVHAGRLRSENVPNSGTGRNRPFADSK